MDGGGVIGGDVPFDYIIPLCHVSSSQEERLRRCPFAPERYNPETDESSSESNGEIPVAFTGIMMVSPPGSEVEDENSNSPDVFHTPPEESAAQSSNELRSTAEVEGRELARRSPNGGGKAAALGVGGPDADGAGTVDLSRDSDLGFSEVQLTQREKADFDLDRSPVEVSERGSMGARVLRRELSLEYGLGESSLKKLKVSEQNLEEFDEELEPMRATPQNRTSDSDENLEINGGYGKPGEQSLAKRKLEFTDDENLTEVVELGTEPNDGVSNPYSAKGNGTNEVNEQQGNGNEKASSQGFVGTSATQETVGVEHQQLSPPARRRLPNSLLGRSDSAADGDKGCHRVEVTMLDVLRLSKEDCDDGISSCSILEICKRRGMTFPRPAWWPEEGADFGDGNDLGTANFGRLRRRRVGRLMVRE